jgi:glycosyltransferase involved in cell wall biosynthesis
MNILRVCVVVPAYNEGLVLAKVVKKAKKSFNKNSDFAVDILVVNDGSKDSTSVAATGAGAIVIDHILNSGAGAATLTGLAYS